MRVPAPSAPSPIQAYLDGLHREFSALVTGEVASYIPELAKADPDGFAIVLATVDGQVYASGDAGRRFSIQSISKPFVYGVALEDRGRARVAQAIGVEPSGDPFNAISLEPGSGRPLNPMINAGAIAAASLVAGDSAEDRLARVLDALSTWAGRPLDIDQAIFESERDTGHRNRAIGHLLRNHGIVDGDPEPALGLYFRQCAVRVDCRDLALMAATLANGGVHPLTGQRAVGADCIAPMLSVMTTCGMYDDSGTWVDAVGLPAKSGVGGGIIAVLPGQLGIGVYSPRLDARGNSARGVAVCRRISADLGLHFLAPPRPSVAALRARYHLHSVRSKRRRPAADEHRLQDLGLKTQVFELQGDLRWATLEPVLRAIVDGDASLLVLDFKRVGHVDHGAVRLLSGLASRCAALGQQLVLSRVRRGGLVELDGLLAPQAIGAVHFQPSLDAALEWCERRLLALPGGAAVAPPTPALADNQLCRGLTPAQLDQLHSCLRPAQHEAGTLIVRRGDAADALVLVGAGEVSVLVDLPGGGSKRLSTLSAGMVFGESALLAGGLRSADVRADTAVQTWSLPASAFARLRTDHPALAAALLHNLLGSAWETIGRLTAEVAALEG
jgi:glutaminase